MPIDATYLTLVIEFPLKVIRDEQTNSEAIEVITRLGRQGEQRPLNVGERDYLDALVQLVERFESDELDP